MTIIKDSPARRAAASLLARGVITAAEAARLAGVSRQLMRHWCRNVDWKRIRTTRIAQLWRKEIARR